jgi:hypothetical protein
VPSLPAFAHQSPQSTIQAGDAARFLNSTQLNLGNITALSDGTEYSFFPQLARAGNNLFVIWVQGNGLFGSHDENLNTSRSLNIVYRVSSNNGTTFGNMQTLHNYTNPQSLGYPVVTSNANGSGAYISWVDNATNDTFDLYFAKSSQNGTGFEAPLKLDASRLEGNSSETLNHTENNTTDTSYSSIQKRIHQVSSPQIAVSTNNRVYLMWTETLAILVKAPSVASQTENSTSAGFMTASYSNNTLTNQNNMQDFSIEDYLPKYNVTTNIFLAASNNSGRSFGETKLVSNSTQISSTGFSAIAPASLAASANNVYVVTSTGSAMDSLDDARLQLYRSSDNGTTFNVREITAPSDAISANGTQFAVRAHPVVTNSSSNSLYMLVTVAQNKTDSILNEQGGKINRFLPSYFDLAFSEYFIRSDNSGANFTKPIQVINRTSNAIDAVVAVSHNGTHVYLAWSDPGLDFFDMLLGGFTSRQYVSPEKLEELNTAGSTLVRASTDRGDTFGETQRLNASKPNGEGISFGGNPSTLVSLGDDGLIIMKTRTSHGGIMERILPNSELILWLTKDGASSFEGPVRISGTEGDVDLGMSTIFGGNSVLLTSDALYVVWSAADYGSYYNATASSDIYLRIIGS